MRLPLISFDLIVVASGEAQCGYDKNPTWLCCTRVHGPCSRPPGHVYEPCSRVTWPPVHTTRDHGPYTRPVNTGTVYRTWGGLWGTTRLLWFAS